MPQVWPICVPTRGCFTCRLPILFIARRTPANEQASIKCSYDKTDHNRLLLFDFDLEGKISKLQRTQNYKEGVRSRVVICPTLEFQLLSGIAGRRFA